MPRPREVWLRPGGELIRRVLVFDELTSTNTVAAELATAGDTCFAVVAEHQTAGRGQYGRCWYAPPGSSLLVSVVFHPPPELSRPVYVTVATILAAARTWDDLTGLNARVKWPNDLLVGGRKVCGVLIERAAATVVGVGLNLNQTAADFAAAGLHAAASVAMLTGRTMTVREAADRFLSHFSHEWNRLTGDDRAGVEVDWLDRLGLLDRPVRAECQDGRVVVGRLRELGFEAVALDTLDGPALLPPEAVRHLVPVGDSQRDREYDAADLSRS